MCYAPFVTVFFLSVQDLKVYQLDQWWDGNFMKNSNRWQTWDTLTSCTQFKIFPPIWWQRWDTFKAFIFVGRWQFDEGLQLVANVGHINLAINFWMISICWLVGLFIALYLKIYQWWDWMAIGLQLVANVGYINQRT